MHLKAWAEMSMWVSFQVFFLAETATLSDKGDFQTKTLKHFMHFSASKSKSVFRIQLESENVAIFKLNYRKFNFIHWKVTLMKIFWTASQLLKFESQS